MENITQEQYKEIKKQVILDIKADLLENGRVIIRGLGTFKVVQHKAKVNNLGEIPARKLVKFRACEELAEAVNGKLLKVKIY